MNMDSNYTIVTAGTAYLDIDAYACAVAMAELLCLQGRKAIAYSKASCNYSICTSLRTCEHLNTAIPGDFVPEKAKYIIVDVSDPDFLDGILPEQVVAVYDHHVGFEAYWADRIGEGAHIEFIGAAATLVYREWKNADLVDRMSSNTARLLIAAILDNTLNLTSSVTTQEDRETFTRLCERENIGEDWCAGYFLEVQKSVEADLENALLWDVKKIRPNDILPAQVGQMAVWDVDSLFDRLTLIRECFNSRFDSWMLNIIDIRYGHSYFVCDNKEKQKKIEQVFGVNFFRGVAIASKSYLRKELIKKTME